MAHLPLLDAVPAIQIHVVAALLSVLLGPFALFGRRGRRHRAFGYAYVTVLALTALSSFAILTMPVIGPFSPIHGFAVLTLWSLGSAIRHARAGRIDVHRTIMRQLYWYGLLIAGLFTLLPGRTLNVTLFPGTPEAGYAMIATGLMALVVHAVRSRRAPEETPFHSARPPLSRRHASGPVRSWRNW